MVMINTIKVIIYIIMYTYSIAITSFQGDDGITTQFYTVFGLTFNIGFLRQKHYIINFMLFQHLFTKSYCIDNIFQAFLILGETTDSTTAVIIISGII